MEVVIFFEGGSAAYERDRSLLQRMYGHWWCSEGFVDVIVVQHAVGSVG